MVGSIYLRVKNKEIFELTLGGLGLTGTIVNVTLSLQTITSTNFLTNKYEVLSLSECIKIVRQKSKNKKSFVYSWNMANNLSNLGNGIVFENIMSDDGTNTNYDIPTKRKIFLNPFFNLEQNINCSC